MAEKKMKRTAHCVVVLGLLHAERGGSAGATLRRNKSPTKQKRYATVLLLVRVCLGVLFCVHKDDSLPRQA